MIYVPDLFSAYIKGEEEAIDRNWQDLKNYENVEALRTNNDLNNVKLQGELWDFTNNRAMSDKEGTQAKVQEGVLVREAPGRFSDANVSSTLAGIREGAVNSNQDLLNTATAARVQALADRELINADQSLAVTGVERKLLPQKADAYETGELSKIGVANAQAQYAPGIAWDIAKAQSIAAQRGILQGIAGYRDDEHYLQTQPTRQQLADEAMKLQGLTIEEQVREIKNAPYQEQLAMYGNLQAERKQILEQIQMGYNSGQPQEWIDEKRRELNEIGALADYVARGINSNGALAKVYQLDPNGMPLFRTSNASDVAGFTPTYVPGSNQFNYMQYTQGGPYDGVGIPAQAYGTDLFGSQEAGTTSPGVGSVVTDSGAVDLVGGGQATTQAVPTGTNTGTNLTRGTNDNPVSVAKDQAYGDYKAGTSHIVYSPSGSPVDIEILGEVTKDGRDFIQAYIPSRGRTIHITREQLDMLKARGPQSSASRVDPMVDYLLGQNPGGFQ